MKQTSCYIEISGICNARCPYCVKGSGAQSQGRFMPVADFEKTLLYLTQHNILPESKIINLYNWGEPFLHPNLNEILSIVRTYGLKAHISSNFLYLPNLSLESLFTLSGVTFSLSGFSQASYGKIHGGSLSKCLENFDLFIELVKKSGSNCAPFVNWHRYRFNETEMSSARDYFAKRKIEFTPTVANLNDLKRSIEYFYDKTTSINESDIIEADLFTDYLENCYVTCQGKPFECPQWNSIVVNERCEVLLCCGWSDNVEGSVFGSIFELPVNDLFEMKKKSLLCIKCIQSGIPIFGFNQFKYDLDSFYNNQKEDKKFILTNKIANTISEQPLISIAMTVYNAAPFLTKSLESLLAQDYRNFELIISDNASDDGSSEICREFAKRDNRIKYSRNTINMGPVRNSFKAVDLCSGEFIMPAADHDLYHPSFISRLLEMLQQDESVVLAYPRTLYIDENEQVIQLTPDVIDTRGLDACDRFRKCIWEFHWMNMVYGLYRSAEFKAVWNAPPTIGSDLVIIANLSLLGAIAQINEPLFYRRRNRPIENSQEMTNRQIKLLVNSNFEALIPWTRMAYEHVKIINESKLTENDKENLYKEIRKCFPIRFGDLMRNEAISLITVGKQTLQNVCSCPNSFDFMKSEFGRIAVICRFFYPDIAELDTFISSTIFCNADAIESKSKVADPFNNSLPYLVDNISKSENKGEIKLYAGDIPEMQQYDIRHP